MGARRQAPCPTTTVDEPSLMKPSHDKRRARVAIAGASGFVGWPLVHALARSHSVVALARESDRRDALAGVEWRVCDLFNLRETEGALAGADVAVYLIQSMMPPAHLTQGTFGDLDLICADNFARAAARSGIRHIVQLGCLLPKPDDGPLPRYFESRLEIERTLRSHGVPLTTLRAGLIIGPGGLVFESLLKLGRLPILIGPSWTRSLSQSIALADAVALLEFALERPDLAGRAYDVGGPDVTSYVEMLRITGQALGKCPHIATLPIRATKLSLLCISAMLGAPVPIVRPLVEGSRRDLCATDGLILQKQAALAPRPLRDAIVQAIQDESILARRGRVVPWPGHGSTGGGVCSVQRLRIRAERSAAWVAEEYVRWLPGFFRQLVRASVDEARTIRFHLWPVRRPLLILTFANDRSSPDRQLFFVTGGLLSRPPEGARPRLEFRTVLDGTFVLAVILDFRPRLPWLIYKFTQARLHLFVMRAFARHLGKEIPASRVA